jgi:hypothetical protein
MRGTLCLGQLERCERVAGECRKSIMDVVNIDSGRSSIQGRLSEWWKFPCEGTTQQAGKPLRLLRGSRAGGSPPPVASRDAPEWPGWNAFFGGGGEKRKEHPRTRYQRLEEDGGADQDTTATGFRKVIPVSVAIERVLSCICVLDACLPIGSRQPRPRRFRRCSAQRPHATRDSVTQLLSSQHGDGLILHFLAGPNDSQTGWPTSLANSEARGPEGALVAPDWLSPNAVACCSMVAKSRSRRKHEGGHGEGCRKKSMAPKRAVARGGTRRTNLGSHQTVTARIEPLPLTQHYSKVA